MKIYTRTGDEGETGLFGGPRISKDDIRIEAYGTIDELNAVLGTVRSCEPSPELDEQLNSIQSELFSIGAELATPDPDKHQMRIVGDTHIAKLESWIDEGEQQLPPLKNFILPTGCPVATQLHVARGVCRRAERRVVTLLNIPEINVSNATMVYLNRLSDLLFVLARVANLQQSVTERHWSKP
ncbi:Cob(I)yrinic acid a,c-diamide adenosyltransferase [Roseimaritima multifibrata]|uniref:Corrinoid adenosyltransferase n=1 Tax=Roseimaritima multifibrata TaxID=1930274 RepID=A0A517MLX0_9BACT|nr:cob(I)yrinic acid a,c-diamide adenosyltransferase [Roseimaritima multifibrata]QDS95882.1 Cob(I)yrinic acid a,c-diamide adenosyltransferase [Roseimaritima multifibrata]